jgi:hypothetical protein
MRSLGLLSVAAAVCVCCVLPSYDGVDRLPGEGQGATSSGASSNSGGNSNLTDASGGKNNGSSGSGVGAEGGDDPGASGSQGTGGSEPGNGGMTSGGTPPSGGAPPGGGDGGTGGMAGAGGKAPVGGASGAGGSGGTGGVSNQCFQWCQGANNVRMKCPNNLGSELVSEASCLSTCQASPEADVNCWVMHTGYADSPTSPHCAHGSGSPGNGVCPVRPQL